MSAPGCSLPCEHDTASQQAVENEQAQMSGRALKRRGRHPRSRIDHQQVGDQALESTHLEVELVRVWRLGVGTVDEGRPVVMLGGGA